MKWLKALFARRDVCPAWEHTHQGGLVCLPCPPPVVHDGPLPGEDYDG